MSTISINNIWASIPNEEKDELLTRAQARGIIASCVFICFTIFIAIDFTQYWFILCGIFSSVIIIPLCANSAWRTEKTGKILRYLAVRSVARRYAYGFGLKRLEVTKIMKGHIQLVEHLSNTQIDFDNFDVAQIQKNDLSEKKAVWICLLQSGLVVISEKTGGAKLEFIANFDRSIKTQYLPVNSKLHDGSEANAIVIAGNIKTREKVAILTSNYKKTLNSLNNVINREKGFLEEEKSKRDFVNSIASITSTDEEK